MRVDTHVTCGATERLAFSIRNVLLGLGIPVLLCHTKIDDMDDCTIKRSDSGDSIKPRGKGAKRSDRERKKRRTVSVLGPWSANQKVIRLDVAVDEVLVVYCLHSCNLKSAPETGEISIDPYSAHQATKSVTYHLPSSHTYSFY